MTARYHDSVPALVFGTTVTALGALRALARLGLTVWTHTEPGDVVTRSRYYRPLPVPLDLDSSASPAVQMETILRALSIPKAFVLPCTDLWTEAVTELPDDLRERFPACVAPRDAIRTLTDKSRLAAVMAELDLPHPRSFVASRSEDLDGIHDRVFESAFLKPKSSPLFLQKFQVKGFQVHSRAEAAQKLREITDAGFEVILQEYVPGPATQHYFIDGFVDSAGQVRARFARRRLRMYPVDFGNSTYMVSVPVAEVQPAMDALETLLRHLDYRGIFSAEFKQDPRDGRFNLIEVNARAWWYVGFAEACGVPVCELAYADALGLPLPGVKPYPVGRTFVYPYVDLQEYRWHRRHRPDHPHASLAACAWTWLSSGKPIFAWDDPRPAAVGSLKIMNEFVRNRIGGKPA